MSVVGWCAGEAARRDVEPGDVVVCFDVWSWGPARTRSPENSICERTDRTRTPTDCIGGAR